MSRPLLLPALLLIVLGIAITGRPDAIIEKRKTPPSLEARADAWLALGRLAAAEGAPVEVMDRLRKELPPRGATLWLPTPGHMIGAKQLAELLGWVRDGGRLVLVPGALAGWQDDDPLLAAAGVSLDRRAPHDLAAALGDRYDLRLPEDLRLPDGLPYAIGGSDRGYVLRAGFQLANALEPRTEDTTRLLCDPIGCRVLRRALGAGSITVIADARAYDNDGIGQLDHAAIAMYLLAPRAGTAFWRVREAAVPDLFTLAWQHAAPALLLLLAAVLLWAWRVSMRFGAPLPSPQPARRRLAEHIEATGTLLARSGEAQALWQACRDALARRLSRRHPATHGLDDEALAGWLARHAGLDRQAVARTLLPPAGDADDEAFARAVRDLETLGRTL